MTTAISAHPGIDHPGIVSNTPGLRWREKGTGPGTYGRSGDGRGSIARPESHLTYATAVALTTEFALTGGARDERR